MRHIGLILTAVVVAAAAAGMVIADESDAAPNYDREFTFNSYDLSFSYGGGTVGDIKVTWSATGILKGTGEEIVIHQIPPEPSKENGWTVFYDPEEVKLCDTVYIMQLITRGDEGDTMVFKVNIVPPPSENKPIVVTFMDGYSGKQVGVDRISEGRYVPAGSDYVYLPETPVREGYTFLGWFTGEDLNTLFDAKKIVTEDTLVYAKWAVGSNEPVPEDPDRPGASLVSLALSGSYRTEYTVGDSLNTTGIAVFAIYSDGSRAEVTSQCVYSPDRFDEAGKVTVSVSYGGLNTHFTVNVAEATPSDPDVPDQPVDPDTPDRPVPDAPGGGSDGTDMTDYLLVVVGVLLAVLIVVVLYRTKH